MKDETKLRADLQVVLDAQAQRLDAARPDAVARQQKRGRWTARQALEAIVDEDSFVEYGGLVRPATKGMAGAADGLVMGTAKVGSRAVDLVLYDYSVYAGTQTTPGLAGSGASRGDGSFSSFKSISRVLVVPGRRFSTGLKGLGSLKIHPFRSKGKAGM